jgi:hypothetical protein
MKKILVALALATAAIIPAQAKSNMSNSPCVTEYGDIKCPAAKPMADYYGLFQDTNMKEQDKAHHRAKPIN